MPASYGGRAQHILSYQIGEQGEDLGKDDRHSKQAAYLEHHQIGAVDPRSAAMRAISVAPAGERESMDSFKSIRNALEIARPIPTQTRIYPAISTRAGQDQLAQLEDLIPGDSGTDAAARHHLGQPPHPHGHWGRAAANFSTITAIREALRVPAGTPDSLPRMPAASATAKVGRNFRRLTCAFFLSRECVP